MSLIDIIPVVLFLSIGLLIGWLAGYFIKRGGYGYFGDIIVGMVGGLIGGCLFRLLDLPEERGSISSMILSAVGAVFFVLMFRQFKKPGDYRQSWWK
jgi:uncharacterized membrane protein YeaQ/YmgE (transglycosylase-associated protein family)